MILFFFPFVNRARDPPVRTSCNTAVSRLAKRQSIEYEVGKPNKQRQQEYSHFGIKWEEAKSNKISKGNISYHSLRLTLKLKIKNTELLKILKTNNN